MKIGGQKNLRFDSAGVFLRLRSFQRCRFISEWLYPVFFKSDSCSFKFATASLAWPIRC
jgi:hypothetical protein